MIRRMDERRCFGLVNVLPVVHMPAKPPGDDRSRTAKPCGPGTRCWCQVGGGVASPTGSRDAVNLSAMVTRRIRRQGERGVSRQTIAQEMPAVVGGPVV